MENKSQVSHIAYKHISGVLVDIIERKKKEIAGKKQSISPLLGGGRGWVNAFYEKLLSAKTISVIAEIKLASPTHPNLGSKEEILQRAIAYEKADADAISFITEKHYFKGDPLYISQLKQAVSLPILQKDFVIDESQIYEAKAIGSDALLLIVRYLDNETVQAFVSLCLKLAIEPVVEINNEEDLQKAITTNTRIIAVNARNLEDFRIDVNKACALMKKVPDKYIKLGFSGIHSAKEVQQYKAAGAKGVLVGTALMKAGNIEMFIKRLSK